MRNLHALERLTVKERLQVVGVAGGFFAVFTFLIVIFAMTTAGDSPVEELRRKLASGEWKTPVACLCLAAGYLSSTLLSFLLLVQGMLGMQTALTGGLLDQLAGLRSPTSPKIPHGFPHLATIRKSIHALYQHLSSRTVRGFPTSLPPDLAILGRNEPPEIAVQRLATTIARHLGLPTGSILVTFEPSLRKENPARVELSDRGECFIDLHPSYRHENQQDVAAHLAHELTHIYLHRAGLSFPTTYENEILTDVAAVYLGIGWLILNSYRRTHQIRFSGAILTREEILGYLTAEEFGYVLAKRSLAFDEAPNKILTSPAARSAFRAGVRRALSEFRTPPLSSSGRFRRALYCRRRRKLLTTPGRPGSVERERPDRGYRFEPGEITKVVLDCPVCGQKLRLPVGRGRLSAHCGVCESALDCET